MTEPNKAALLAWVEKLESGTVEQGAQCLARQGSDGVVKMCCLGVVTDMFAGDLGLEKDAVQVGTYDAAGNRDGTETRFTWNGAGAVLPTAVVKFLGVPSENFCVTDTTGYRQEVASLNDRGRTFPELAAMIRAEFQL